MDWKPWTGIHGLSLTRHPKYAVVCVEVLERMCGTIETPYIQRVAYTKGPLMLTANIAAPDLDYCMSCHGNNSLGRNISGVSTAPARPRDDGRGQERWAKNTAVQSVPAGQPSLTAFARLADRTLVALRGACPPPPRMLRICNFPNPRDERLQTSRLAPARPRTAATLPAANYPSRLDPEWLRDNIFGSPRAEELRTDAALSAAHDPPRLQCPIRTPISTEPTPTSQYRCKTSTARPTISTSMRRTNTAAPSATGGATC